MEGLEKDELMVWCGKQRKEMGLGGVGSNSCADIQRGRNEGNFCGCTTRN